MVEYKGFKIPNTVSEVRDMLLINRSCTQIPTYCVHNENGTTINLPVSVEHILDNKTNMDDIVLMAKAAIDQCIESTANN